jgi:hypothetical protein
VGERSPIPPAARLLGERIIAFAAPVAIVVYYALRRGTYDVVDRGELGVAIWLVLAIGFGTGVLPRTRLPRAAALPLAGAAALVGWTLLSFTWTQSDERTAVELARTIHHAGIFVLALAVVGPSTWRFAVGGLVAGAGIVCAFAVASRLAPGWFPSDEVQSSFDLTRLTYPLNYWNAVAAWGAVTATMALVISAHARHAAARALALAAVPLAVIAVYWTYSRAGVVGVGIGLVAALGLSTNRWALAAHALVAGAGSTVAILVAREQPELAQATNNGGADVVLLVLAVACAACAVVAVVTERLGVTRVRLPARPGRIAVAAAIGAVLVAGVAVGPGVASEAYDSFRGAKSVSGSSQAAAPDRADPAQRLTDLGGNRYDLWSVSLDAYEERPFKGSGPGTFEYVWQGSARDAEFLRDAHSLYFETLVEAGWVGLLFVIVLLAGALAAGAAGLRRLGSAPERGAAAAMLAAGIVFVFHLGVDWIWEATAAAVLGLLALGLATVGSAPDRIGRLAPGWRAAGALVAALACLVQLLPTVSTSRYRASQREEALGNRAEALRLANDAIAATPWASSPYAQRALLAERAGDLTSASVDLARAARHEPTNWQWQLLLARVEAKRGRALAALRAYEKARRLNPLNRVFPAPKTKSS